jgi:hypothetical protein
MALEAMMATGLVLGATGQVMAGIQAKKEAEAQAAMAEYNAKVAQREAEARENRAAFEQSRHAKAASRQLSSLRAGLSAANVVPSEGTPLLIQAEQATESELENLMIGYEGQVGAAQSRSQAAIDRMQADVYRTRGSIAATSGLFGAGTTLLTGFSNWYRSCLHLR